MSPTRIAAVALLVAVAGCTGLAPTDGTETTVPPTEQPTTQQPTTGLHTAEGTSHIGEHLTVRASAGIENVTVTLAPDGDAENREVAAGAEVDLTREVHDRGHDVRVVVERGGEVVFDEQVRAYEYYDVVVYENDTSVDYVVV